MDEIIDIILIRLSFEQNWKDVSYINQVFKNDHHIIEWALIKELTDLKSDKDDNVHSKALNKNVNIHFEFIVSLCKLIKRWQSVFYPLYGKLPSPTKLKNIWNVDQYSICGLEGDLLCSDVGIGSYRRRCINFIR